MAETKYILCMPTLQTECLHMYYNAVNHILSTPYKCHIMTAWMMIFEFRMMRNNINNVNPSSARAVGVRYPNLGIKVPVEVLRVISSRSADWILDLCPSMLLWLSMMPYQHVVMVISFEQDHEISRLLAAIITLHCIWIRMRKITLSNNINRSIVLNVWSDY